MSKQTNSEPLHVTQAASSDHPEFLRRSYFSGLDGIRCLAITCVIWHHTPGRESVAIPMLQRGYLGVDLFFVLSGFLITTILIREEKKTGTVSLRNFYARRSLRIFPLYYSFLLALAVWTWLTSRDEFLEYTQVLPYYLFYLTNFVERGSRIFFEHGWSLAVEEQFYLFWPTLIKLIGIRRAARVIAAIVLGLAAVAVVSQESYVHIHNLVTPFRTILVGCLLAILLNSPTGYAAFQRVFGGRATVLWALGAIGLLLIPPGKLIGAWEFSIHLTMAILVGAVVINERNLLMPILTLPLVKTVGIVSYGIYLTHSQFIGIVVEILNRTLQDVPIGLLFAAFLLVSTTVAYICYYGFEVNFLKMKRYFVTKQ